jgi:hypothetical protein
MHGINSGTSFTLGKIIRAISSARLITAPPSTALLLVGAADTREGGGGGGGGEGPFPGVVDGVGAGGAGTA